MPPPDKYIYRDCPRCKGSGKVISPPSAGPADVDCPECRGKGIIFWGYLKANLEE